MSRSRYVETVSSLARNPGVDGMPESHHLAARIGMADVAAATGSSRAHLYRLWETQYDFLVDLSRYLTLEADFAKSEYEMPWNAQHAPLPPAHAPIEPDAVDGYLSGRYNAVSDAMRGNLRVLTRATSIGYPETDVIGSARIQTEAIRFAASVDDIAATATAMGRSFASPVTDLDVSVATWCVADGMSVLGHFAPDLADVRPSVDFGSGVHDWSLLALIARALFVGASLPAEAGERTDRTLRPPLGPPRAPIAWSPPQIEALSAAADLFVETLGAGDEVFALGHVTVARVAAAAGVSRRAVYNVWPTRDDMMIDLLDDLMSSAQASVLDCWRAHGRHGIERLTDTVIGPPRSPRWSDPLLAYASDFGHDRCRETVALGSRRLVAELATCIEVTLTTSNRRPRPGIAHEHLATIWLCYIEGARRLRRTSPQFDVSHGNTLTAILDGLTVES